MKLLKITLGLIVSAICLYLALKGIAWNTVFATIVAANFLLLIPAILLHFTAFYIRAIKWSIITSKIKPISAIKLFPIVAIGLAMNNVLPLRAGEFGRIVLLSNTHGISKVESTITIIIERIFDIVGLLVILLVFLKLRAWPGYANALINSAGIFLLICIVSIPVVFYFSDRLLKLPYLKKLQGLKIITDIQGGYKTYHTDYFLMLKTLLLSVSLWFVEGLGYFVMANMFSLHISFPDIIFICALVNISSIVPATAGFIGTFEFFATGLLVFTGITRAKALAYVLVLHAELILPITIVGIVLYFTGKYYNYLTFKTLEQS